MHFIIEIKKYIFVSTLTHFIFAHERSLVGY